MTDFTAPNNTLAIINATNAAKMQHLIEIWLLNMMHHLFLVFQS